MPDNVSLHLEDTRIGNFLSYTVDGDLYTADHAFSLELANPEIPVRNGARCTLYVNGRLELTGLVEKITRRYDKESGVRLTVEGRDLMGILVDAYVEKFVTVQNMKLKTLAEMLVERLPFINRSDISYQENIRGGLKSHKKKGGGNLLNLFDTPQKIAQLEPGMTVFETLKEFAHSRGMMFFSMPDGKFVFGRPVIDGDPTFRLINRKDGVGNNVEEGELVDDLTRRYYKVTVIGQQQGHEGLEAAQVNTYYDEFDQEFPFYKPMVVKNNNDYQSPKLHARMAIEKMRHEGKRLTYRVPGHSQSGANWGINELCHVTDEVLGIDGVYLIYGRTFELGKDSGTITRLRLGPRGVAA